jgi:hypothetical protein
MNTDAKIITKIIASQPGVVVHAYKPSPQNVGVS